MYGERLKELRKDRKWTIEVVAGKLGVSKSTYAGYETEYRSPPIDKLIDLSKLYNVSVDYILGISEEKDIKVLECDLSKYLRKGNIHWDGVPLGDEELKPFRDVLDMMVRNKGR